MEEHKPRARRRVASQSTPLADDRFRVVTDEGEPSTRTPVSSDVSMDALMSTNLDAVQPYTGQTSVPAADISGEQTQRSASVASYASAAATPPRATLESSVLPPSAALLATPPTAPVAVPAKPSEDGKLGPLVIVAIVAVVATVGGLIVLWMVLSKAPTAVENVAPPPATETTVQAPGATPPTPVATVEPAQPPPTAEPTAEPAPDATAEPDSTADAKGSGRTKTPKTKPTAQPKSTGTTPKTPTGPPSPVIF